MKKLTIGFSTSKKWNPFSALIKWWWKTPYSHTYLKWDTPWGFDEVFEASGNSVRMVNEDIWKLKNDVVFSYELIITKAEFHEMMKNVRPLSGKPYGWTQAFGMLIRELLGLKRNPLSDRQNSLVCSEVVLEALNSLKILAQIDRDVIAPIDIYNLVILLKKR